MFQCQGHKNGRGIGGGAASTSEGLAAAIKLTNVHIRRPRSLTRLSLATF